MDDAQKTESIRNLVQQIEKENIVLPEFQRDFVWDVAKTYDLFDSLVRDVFIGALIYGVPSFEITVREIDDRPRKRKGKRRKSLHSYELTKENIEQRTKIGNFRLILDGQQRLTSLYRAVKGIDEVWFIAKNEDELSEAIREKPPSKRALEEILHEFSGQDDPERISVKISDVWKVVENEIVLEEEKRNLLTSTEFCKGLDPTSAEFTSRFRRFVLLLRDLERLLEGEKLISYYLLNTSSEKFALFFERSNSRGFDLVLSTSSRPNCTEVLTFVRKQKISSKRTTRSKSTYQLLFVPSPT